MSRAPIFKSFSRNVEHWARANCGCVCQFGLCTPSPVPPQPFRELRALSRQRRIRVGQRSTVRNRVQKIIDRAGTRIGGILASLTSHVANKLEGLGEALTLSLGDYDRTADYDALLVKRNAPRWIRMLRRYGYIEPVEAELKAA